MTKPKHLRHNQDIRQRLRDCDSEAQFNKLLAEAKRETDAAAREYMEQVEAEDAPQEPVVDVDDLADTVASWALDEMATANKFFEQALKDRRALAAAMGIEVGKVPAAWDPASLPRKPRRPRRTPTTD